MRKHVVCGFGVVLSGLLTLTLAACGGGSTVGDAGGSTRASQAAPAGASGATTAPPSTAGPAAKQRAGAIVDHVDVGAGPGGVSLLVIGQLPTPCHELQWKAGRVDTTGRVVVEVFSEIEADALCSQVIQPFERTIPLGPFPTGSYTAVVNGTAYPFRA